VSRKKLHGPFFIAEATVTGDSILDMLEGWLLPQLNTNDDDYILQMEGAPPATFTGMYECFSIVISAGSDVLLKMQTKTSPFGHSVRQIIHRAIPLLGGIVKDSIYVPKLPRSIHELRNPITHALKAITADMPHRGWDEIDYRVDIHRVTQHALQAITADMPQRGWDEFDYRVDMYRVTQGAQQAITADMLHRGWEELDYRVDVCRVTQGALQAITADKLHWVWDKFDYRVDMYRVTQHALQAITVDMLHWV
jgi:hypothetical protein